MARRFTGAGRRRCSAAAAGSAPPGAAGHQPAEAVAGGGGCAAGGGGAVSRMTGRSITPPAPADPARPTRKGRKSSSSQVQHAHDARRQRQDDVGLLRLAAVVREQSSHERKVAQPGHPFEHAPLVVADQARQQVRLAVLQADHGVDLAIAEGGQPAEAGAGNTADQNLQRQRHLAIVMRARRDVDVHADVLVVERRDRLLRDAAGRDRREHRDRHRHTLAEPRLRGHAFRRAELGVRQRPRVAVGLQQSIEEARHVRQEDVGRAEVAAGRAASDPRG